MCHLMLVRGFTIHSSYIVTFLRVQTGKLDVHKQIEQQSIKLIHLTEGLVEMYIAERLVKIAPKVCIFEADGGTKRKIFTRL